MQIGTLVRLIGDPLEMGAYHGEFDHGGRVFAKIQFRTGIRRVPLDQIESVPTASEEPLDLLRAGRFSDPRRLRQVLTHVKLTGRLSDMIYSMESSDTEFHAHQFKPVLKMLASPTGGLLIADEVGLGKTIEAGLIWTELRARFDFGRLLVVCPKVLCQKWSMELANKFAIDARIVSADDLLQTLRSPEANRRGFQLICSLQGLQPPRGWDDEDSGTYGRSSAALARFLSEQAHEEPLIDLLVIDEAHHLRNPETQRNLLGRLLRPISQHKAFLSATPIQLRNRDLFSLLRLLDPDTFRRNEDLEEILAANRPLIAARESLLRLEPLTTVKGHVYEANTHRLICGSQQLLALLNEIDTISDQPSNSERARLAGRLEQVNLLSAVVNRTRRRDVQELRVVRQVFAHTDPMSPPEQEVYDVLSSVVQLHALQKDINAPFLLAMPQRMLSSCLPAAVNHWRNRKIDWEIEDDVSEDEEDERDPRPLVEKLAERALTLPTPDILARNDSKFGRFIGVLRKFLAENPNDKIVVFSTFRSTLSYLGDRLDEERITSVTIHGNIGDRDDVLAHFAEDERIRVLLSSEVGSEGLDLQFCRALVNYDLPWNPMRVEQRIGRIDRMGQQSPSISVINLLNAGTIDEKIYHRLYERLGLCKQALGDFEAILGVEITKLTSELLSGRLSSDEQDRVIEQTALAVENKKKLTEELEEEASNLMAHGDQVLQKIFAAKDLSRWMTATDLARYITEALNTIYPGCSLRDLPGDDIYELHLTSDARLDYSDFLTRRGLPRGGKIEREISGVICRLGRPAVKDRRRGLEAVGQSHPFVRFLADRISETDASRLRPTVAVRVPIYALTDPNGKGQDSYLAPGRYAVLASLWRFGGIIEQERVVYTGIVLDDATAITQENAERLVNAALGHGGMWASAEADVDGEAVADLCNRLLVDKLNALFSAEESSRKAEQNDRSEIQLRNLEHRFAQERQSLIERIDKQQRSSHTKGSMLAANQGKLRKLEERTTQRRRKIEESRKVSSQQEALFAMVVDIVA
jgi:superfamily II DNA or RNA helicase